MTIFDQDSDFYARMENAQAKYYNRHMAEKQDMGVRLHTDIFIVCKINFSNVKVIHTDAIDTLKQNYPAEFMGFYQDTRKPIFQLPIRAYKVCPVDYSKGSKFFFPVTDPDWFYFIYYCHISH
jgi:hypothetical protein